MSRETLGDLLAASRCEGELLELLEASSGEITPEIETFIARVSEALPAKVDAYRNFQESLSARLDLISKRIADMTRVKKSLALVSERADKYLFDQMKANSLTVLEGHSCRYRIVSCSKRTVIDDESKVPAQYKTIITTEVIDKASVKNALELGESVSGAHLEGGETLRSYTK